MKRSVTKKRIRFFQDTLLAWYAIHKRNYEWRQPGLDAYDYIIAEVLLQRTNANTIAKFYSAFIRDYPNWQSLADVASTEIESYLKPIGLYKQRAKRLQMLAIEMVRRGGALPLERGELEQIPFFGQYIANAVELIVFKRPKPLLDVNMARLLERYFGPRQMADIRYDPYLQELAQKVVLHDYSTEINWTILDFAALVCKARNPRHEICPLKESCMFYKNSVL